MDRFTVQLFTETGQFKIPQMQSDIAHVI